MLAMRKTPAGHQQRRVLDAEVRAGLKRWPVTAILGPRQCGKTTLAQSLAVPPSHFFDLENATDLSRLGNNPMGVLGALRGVVVIDEIQRMPELFTLLRPLADRAGAPARFVVLGSVAPALARGVSESLAGRVRFVDMGGFDLAEVGARHLDRLWWRGGYPRAFLAQGDAAAREWMDNVVRALRERDLPAMVQSRLSSVQLGRLLTLLAHFHGQHWNSSEAARTLDVDYKTVQRYVELMAGAFLLRVVPAYFKNTGKRLRKAHRLYLRDSGLLHSLLGLATFDHLLAHPKLGASWEGFAIEQVIRLLRVREDQCFHWSVASGPEVDLVVEAPGGPFGFEMKYTDRPGATSSMHTGLSDLGLKRLYVIYPGEKDFPLTEKIEVVAMKNLPLLKLSGRITPIVDPQVFAAAGGARSLT